MASLMRHITQNGLFCTSLVGFFQYEVWAPSDSNPIQPTALDGCSFANL